MCMPSTVFIGYDKTRHEATSLSQNIDAKRTPSSAKATKPLQSSTVCQRSTGEPGRPCLMQDTVSMWRLEGHLFEGSSIKVSMRRVGFGVKCILLHPLAEHRGWIQAGLGHISSVEIRSLQYIICWRLFVVKISMICKRARSH